jgi:hypothetical protein
LADIKLFQLHANSARELRAESVDIEKSLQSLMEQHLESFLGVRFLATEYVTGKAHGCRIDTLGLDDNNCPSSSSTNARCTRMASVRGFITSTD